MNLLDLISRDTTLSKAANTRNGEYAGPCPWCGGRDRFRVWPYAEHPGYWCRQCSRKGDAAQYLRDRYNLTFPEACARLRQPFIDAPRPRSTPKPPPLAEPPRTPWQEQARAFVEACEKALWTSSGRKGTAYLHSRGL